MMLEVVASKLVFDIRLEDACDFYELKKTVGAKESTGNSSSDQQ